MRLPSWSNMFKIASLTGIGGIVGIFLVQKVAVDEVSKAPYFREAFKILRAHEGAKKYLGEPIKQLRFSPSDKYNLCDGHKAQFYVRVEGPNDRGTMYFWALRREDNTWDVTRIELELGKQPGKRLLVKKVPTSDEPKPETIEN